MKKSALNLIRITLLALLIVSCSSDDNTGDPTPNPMPGPIIEENNYALITATQSGSFTFNNYLQPFKALDGETAYTNENAVEISADNYGCIFDFEGDLYVSNTLPPQRMDKWSYDEDGEKYVNEGGFTTTELGSPGNPYFKDENIAFIGGTSAQSILIFDPSSMTKTGAIDLSSVSRIGEVTNIPSSGDTVNIEIPTEMIIRGDYLFVAMFLVNSASTGFIPASYTADILVIDHTKIDPNSTNNSDAIVKWISSDKGICLGSFSSAFGAKYMIEDEMGDIYVLAHSLWGTPYGKPTCILRIKSGETDFDPDYYYNLEAAARGLGNPIANLEYAGSGKFFASVMDTAAINPDDPFSFFIDPIWQWYQFDLYDTDTMAVKVSDEYSRGGGFMSISYLENGNIYIPYQNKTESYIKEIDLNTLENSNLFTTIGAPFVKKIN